MKIIASDYDGTLNHGGIDDTKRNAIKRWRKAGNLFGLVSGRGAESLLAIPQKENFEYDFLLASNGAVILIDGKVAAESCCDGALAKPFLEYIMSIGCGWADVHTAFNCAVALSDEKRPEDEFTLETLPDIPHFNQISTILPDENEAARVTAAIKEKFGEHLNPLQNGRCIDIVAADMNKAQGLYKLLEIIGAEYGDLITVGDNINDTHMIAEFRSYAMANAVQSIKDIADDEILGITELIEREMGK